MNQTIARTDVSQVHADVTKWAANAGAVVVPVVPDPGEDRVVDCGGDLNLLRQMLDVVDVQVLYLQEVRCDDGLLVDVTRAHSSRGDRDDFGAEPDGQHDAAVQSLVQDVGKRLLGCPVQVHVALVHDTIVHLWSVRDPAWTAMLDSLDRDVTERREQLRRSSAQWLQDREVAQRQLNAFTTALSASLLDDEDFLRLPNVIARRAFITDLVHKQFGDQDIHPMPSPRMVAESMAGPIRVRKDERARALRARFADLTTDARARLQDAPAETKSSRVAVVLELLREHDDWVATTAMAEELLDMASADTEARPSTQ